MFRVTGSLFVSILVLFSLSKLSVAQQARPPQGSTAPQKQAPSPAKSEQLVPIQSNEQLEALKRQLDEANAIITATERAIAARKAYQSQYDSLVTKAKEAREATTDLDRQLKALRSGAGSPPDKTLRINAAEFGDFKYRRLNHTCDATPYFLHKCKLAADATSTSTYCVISSVTAADYCGYVPSPQGKNAIRIDYNCGGARQQPLTLPASVSSIRLICDAPDAPKRSSNAGAGATPNTAEQTSESAVPVQPKAGSGTAPAGKKS